MDDELDDHVWVLTYEYSDKSGFYVCGVTRNITVAAAWKASADWGQKVYRMQLDDIVSAAAGAHAEGLL